MGGMPRMTAAQHLATNSGDSEIDAGVLELAHLLSEMATTSPELRDYMREYRQREADGFTGSF